MATDNFDRRSNTSNYSIVAAELPRILYQLETNKDVPLVSLDSAVKLIEPFVPELEKMLLKIKQDRVITADQLTPDESNAILLLTLKWTPIHKSFHVILNTTLQTRSQVNLRPWLRYLRLLMTGLRKIQSNTRITVYHAVKLNLISQYAIGRKFVWWDFTLCTSSLNVLNNEYILGQNGVRTLFIIDSRSAKCIQEHTMSSTEDVIIPSSCHFEVKGCFNAGNGLYIVNLKEIKLDSKITGFTARLPPIPSTRQSYISKGDVSPLHSVVPTPRSSSLSPSRFRHMKIFSNRCSLMEPSLYKDSECSTREFQDKQITITNPYIKKWIDALQHDQKLYVMDLSRSNINDEDLKVFVGPLIKNRTVSLLNLQFNSIGPKGAQYLARILKKNATLTAINLEMNQISDQGVQFIAKALQKNSSLVSLNLRSNQIRPQGIQHLSNALLQNNTIMTLDLRFNKIGNLGALHLAKALENNRSITTLNIADNQIKTNGAECIAQALEQNPTLVTLDLENNQIGSQGAQYFQNVLQKNKSLMLLNLRNNQINFDEKYHIKELSEAHRRLKLIL